MIIQMTDEQLLESQLQSQSSLLKLKKASKIRILCAGRSSLNCPLYDNDFDYITVNWASGLKKDAPMKLHELGNPPAHDQRLQRDYFKISEVFRAFFSEGVTIHGLGTSLAPPFSSDVFRVFKAGSHHFTNPCVIKSQSTDQLAEQLRYLLRIKPDKLCFPIAHQSGSVTHALTLCICLGYEKIEIWGADLNNEYYFFDENLFKDKEYEVLRSCYDHIRRVGHPDGGNGILANNYKRAYAEGIHPSSYQPHMDFIKMLPVQDVVSVIADIAKEQTEIVWVRPKDSQERC